MTEAQLEPIGEIKPKSATYAKFLCLRLAVLGLVSFKKKFYEVSWLRCDFKLPMLKQIYSVLSTTGLRVFVCLDP